MKIGLIDVDGHNFPNLALMKISAFHKLQGDGVEWMNVDYYDMTYISKVFTFTEDKKDWLGGLGQVFKGDTGYDVNIKLPENVESCDPDYAIYPNHKYSIQLFSRGCVRNCEFCIVREKEGIIYPVAPMKLNPNGEHIEVLDNNFFANPNWKESIQLLIKWNQPVNLHGVDIRLMNEEQAFYLNKLKLQTEIHIAWDNPKINLIEKFKEIIKYIKPYKLACYVLIGFDSDIEQDMFRIETLRNLNIDPFVQPYRGFNGNDKISQYCKDLARYVNKKWIFKSCSFKEFRPRKNFKCVEYFK